MTLLCGILGDTYFLVSGDIIGRGVRGEEEDATTAPGGGGREAPSGKLSLRPPPPPPPPPSKEHELWRRRRGDFINDRRGMAGVTDEVGG